MTDKFDITNEEGDFIHINYVTSEESNKLENGDEELFCDESDWVWVGTSNNSKPELQKYNLEHEETSSKSSNEGPCFKSSFYELVTDSLKASRDESVLENKTTLSTSEIDAELLYLPEEKLKNIVPFTIDNTEYDDLDFDIYREEDRFILEYNEEIDMCEKSKAHSELLDIYPDNFMGLDSKNDLLGGRSRKRRCKKMDLNKKTDINSRFYSFRFNKDALWVYKNA